MTIGASRAVSRVPIAKTHKNLACQLSQAIRRQRAISRRFASVPTVLSFKALRTPALGRRRCRDATPLELQAPSGDYKIQVEMGWHDTPADTKSSHGNAGGWMHMMCCLKAYLEYGINLRAGGAR